MVVATFRDARDRTRRRLPRHRAVAAGLDAGHVARRADVDRQRDDGAACAPIPANARRGRVAGERADPPAARQQRRPRGDHRRGTLARVSGAPARSLRRASHARRGAAVAASLPRCDRRSEQGDGRRSARCVELRRRRRRLHGAGRLHARLRGVRSNGAAAAGAAGLRAHGVCARDQGRPRRRARIHAAGRRRHLAERCRIAGLALRAGRRPAAAARTHCARRGLEYERAEATFPGHPMAIPGWRASRRWMAISRPLA